jgi:hypothetical protein
MDNDEADFGSYLVTVEERDIDLLLMEEFHVSEEFVEWFCRQLAMSSDVSFNGAWHSVSNTDGETDLLLRVRFRTRRIGILIENKIAAPEQDRQDERYHVRGTRAQEEGMFDDFVTCMCAPQVYLDGIEHRSLYEHRISYEMIAEWFAALDGRRHAWRRRIMQEAIQQGRRGYKMIVNTTVSEFHMAYWEYLHRRHPRIYMKKPTPKGNSSNWILMKGPNFPKRVSLSHKLDQRVVELGFEGRKISEVLAIKSDWPYDIVPDQKGGTAVLSIHVPAIDMTKGFCVQEESLEEVFAAVHKLIPYGRLLAD